MFVIVAPQQYQSVACYLAGTIGACFGQTVKLACNCPDSRIDAIDPSVEAFLARMDCEVQPLPRRVAVPPRRCAGAGRGYGRAPMTPAVFRCPPNGCGR